MTPADLPPDGNSPVGRDGDHPDADLIQRYADGDVEALDDRVLREHLVTCDECRRDLDRIREVNASLALSSRAPDLSFARIKQRRAAGDRPALSLPESPTLPEGSIGVSDHPSLEDLHRYADADQTMRANTQVAEHVATCPTCQTEVEEARRVAAVLALTSSAPAPPFDQLRARRQMGERVMLPIPETRRERNAVSAQPMVTGQRPRFKRPSRPYAWASAVAATLLVAIGLRLTLPGRPIPGPGRPDSSVVARADSSVVARADSSVVAQEPVRADTSAVALLPPASPDPAFRNRNWGAIRAGVERIRAATPLLTVSFAPNAIRVELHERHFAGAGLTPTGADAVRELGVLLSGQADQTVVVATATPPAPNDSSAVALQRGRGRAVRDALIQGGIRESRVREQARDRTAAPTQRNDPMVTIEIVRPAPAT